MANPASIPYTQEIDDILSPFKTALADLLTGNSSKLKSDVVPAAAWLESKNFHPQTIIPYVGSLSVIEQAQIANWFEVQVAKGNKTLRQLWIGYLPIAHAHTLYIVHQLLKCDSKLTSLTRKDLLEHAWEVQFAGSSRLLEIDVDRDCLYDLEEEMFEVSTQSGIASFFQWGLDAGHHQDNWYPYNNMPPDWNDGNYNWNEDNLAVSFFDTYNNITYNIVDTGRTSIHSL